MLRCRSSDVKLPNYIDKSMSPRREPTDTDLLTEKGLRLNTPRLLRKIVIFVVLAVFAYLVIMSKTCCVCGRITRKRRFAEDVHKFIK